MIRVLLFLQVCLLAASLAVAQPAVAPQASPAQQTMREISAAPAEPTKPGEVEPGLEVRWVRDSAEYRAATIQAFSQATKTLDALAKAHGAQPWAVALDGDETVLSNMGFQIQLAQQAGSGSRDDWNNWCRRKEATAIPGAVAFLNHVHELGGKIVIVTNRSTDLQKETEENFRAQKLAFDLMLCRSATGDKNPRWESVESGTAQPGVPAMKILMFVGDNIQDFPKMTQAVGKQGDAALSDFGNRFIIIPNPMYGSWTRSNIK